MSSLETIVASLELCKKIPAGEFEDTALVWVYDDVVGFLCRTSGCEQIHKKEWQLEHNHPRKIAIRRKCGQEIYPAPTAGEIMAKLDTPSLWHRGTGRWYCMCKEHVMVEAGENTSDAALRLWLRVKGIEVK